MTRNASGDPRRQAEPSRFKSVLQGGLIIPQVYIPETGEVMLQRRMNPPGWTAEFIELPTTSRVDQNTPVWHYTQAGVPILTSSQLRMRHVGALIEQEELEPGLAVIQDVWEAERRHHSPAIRNWVQRMLQTMPELLRTSPIFVLSVSSNSECDYLWEHYAKGGSCIELSASWSRELRVVDLGANPTPANYSGFRRVIYDRPSQETLALKLIRFMANMPMDVPYCLRGFSSVAPFMKAVRFAVEEEVRFTASFIETPTSLVPGVPEQYIYVARSAIRLDASPLGPKPREYDWYVDEPKEAISRRVVMDAANGAAALRAAWLESPFHDQQLDLVHRPG